jgi:hypothetical protein
MQSGRAREFYSPPLRSWALALLLGLLLAPPAGAGILTIQFDFQLNSSLSVLGGAINTPPDGAITSGSAVLKVEADSATSSTVGGFAQLLSANLAGVVDKDIQGQAQVNGSFSIDQTTPANGTLAAGDTISFSDSFTSNINANFACTGPECSTLGLPVNEAGVFVLPIQPLLVTDLEVVGSALIDLDLPVSLDGVQAVFHLVGVETSRSFVIPEPGTASLLGLGLLALATRRR